MVTNKLGNDDNPLSIPIDETMLSSTVQSNLHIDNNLVKAVCERFNSLSSLKYELISSLIKDIGNAKLYHSPIYNSLLGLFLRGLEKDSESKHIYDAYNFLTEHVMKGNIPLPPSFYTKVDDYFSNYITNNPTKHKQVAGIID
jgi:hypothetical protein